MLGLTQAAAVEKLEAAGLEAEVGDPAYSETVPAGRVIEHRPRARRPGPRRRHRHASWSRSARSATTYPKLRGMTEDEAQDALAERNLEFGETIEQVLGERSPRAT